MIKIDEIVVEDRQREDLGDIEEQAESFKQYGQLQPIVVEERDGKYYLRAGGRRVAAAVIIGWTEIDALVRGEMTELEAQLVELEENIRRKALDWKEEGKAIDKIHKLKIATVPGWTAKQTAELIGKSRRTVYNYLELSQAVDTIPDVAAADKPLAALNRLRRHNQIKQRQEEVVLRRVQVERGKKPNLFWHVHQGDCVAYMKENIDDGTMDMVLTDPPWSIDYDDLLIGEQKSFDDSLAVLPTVRDACREYFRILRDQRFCFMYWPTNEVSVDPIVLKDLGAPMYLTLHDLGRWFLTSAGFWVYPRPIIWYKPNKNFGNVRDPSKQFTSQYETIFVAAKGDARFFKRPESDVFVGDTPGPDKLHPNEKNLEVSEIFIDMCTVPGENVFDGFAGGGVHGEAALRQERNAHLVELDVEFAERCSMRCESIEQKKLSGEIPDLGRPASDISESATPRNEELPIGVLGKQGDVGGRSVLPNPNRAINARTEEVLELDNHLFDGEGT
jgi:ParB/RepB/Spo0J family partition protein